MKDQYHPPLSRIDIQKAIAELREERDLIDESIAVLERVGKRRNPRLLGRHERRLGRNPLPTRK